MAFNFTHKPITLAGLLLLILAGSLVGGSLPDTPFARIDQLQDHGKLREAEALLIQVEAEGTESPEFYYQKGRLFLNRGDPANAVLWLEKAIDMEPENARFLATLGSAFGLKAAEAPLLEKPGHASRMKTFYHRAIDLDPTQEEPWLGLIEYHLQAPPLFGGNRRKAEKLAEAYAEINPYFGALARARIAFHEGDFSAALKHLNQAVALDPQHRMALFMRAVLANNQEAYDLAWQSLEKLLELYPDDSAVIYQVGKYAALSGKHLDRGKAALEKYLAFEERPYEPSHASAYWRMGMILEHQQKWSQARQAYRQSVALDPRLEEPARLLTQLEEKRNATGG